jgi:hypothetical protein
MYVCMCIHVCVCMYTLEKEAGKKIELLAESLEGMQVMCVCMYVCVCACSMYVCMYVCICVCVFMCAEHLQRIS